MVKKSDERLMSFQDLIAHKKAKAERKAKRKKQKTPKQKVVRLLGNEGYHVSLIWGAQGFYRTRQSGCDVRFEVHAYRNSDNRFFYMRGYDTMTECAKRGIQITEGDVPGWLDIDPKDEDDAKTNNGVADNQ